VAVSLSSEAKMGSGEEVGGKERMSADVIRGRLTRKRLDAFAAEHASVAPALVVHSRDLDHRRHFPNARHIDLRPETGTSAASDYLTALRAVPSASEQVLVCTGLLEHLPDPGTVVDEFERILAPGGRLIVSASAVFPFHGAPENYYHFAPNGLRRLMTGFETVEIRGSTGPFETLAVLAQRIRIQCDLGLPLRLLLAVMVRMLPVLDRFVVRQYDHLGRAEAADPRIGFMPATLMAAARKREA
jgi:SAM-dependent methyltransferase